MFFVFLRYAIITIPPTPPHPRYVSPGINTLCMNNQNRADIHPGQEVEIVLKADQPTGALTRGIVAEILTNSATHPRGIKVRLQDGRVGGVQKIIF